MIIPPPPPPPAPPPPPPSPILIRDVYQADQNGSDSSRKTTSNIYIVLFAISACLFMSLIFHFVPRSNGVPRGTGATGSTPGKVLNKLKNPTRIQPLQAEDDDPLAVRSWPQEVPLDREVLWTTTTQGTELRSVNGQNPRTGYKGSNGKMPPRKISITQQPITSNQVVAKPSGSEKKIIRIIAGSPNHPVVLNYIVNNNKINSDIKNQHPKKTNHPVVAEKQDEREPC